MIVTTDPKAMAPRPRHSLARHGVEITPSKALELVAAQLGFRDWNTCAAVTELSPAPTTIPIVRTFPGVEHAGSTSTFSASAWTGSIGSATACRCTSRCPREGCVLHLSEHHGDATPGSAVRIQMANVGQLQRELAASPVYPLRIGVSAQPWGDDLTVPDPFGNRIIFHTPGQWRIPKPIAAKPLRSGAATRDMSPQANGGCRPLMPRTMRGSSLCLSVHRVMYGAELGSVRRSPEGANWTIRVDHVRGCLRESTGCSELAISAPACRESGGLVALVPGGVRGAAADASG